MNTSLLCHGFSSHLLPSSFCEVLIHCESVRHNFFLRIRSSDGWTAADETLRHGVVSTANKFGGSLFDMCSVPMVYGGGGPTALRSRGRQGICCGLIANPLGIPGAFAELADVIKVVGFRVWRSPVPFPDGQDILYVRLSSSSKSMFLGFQYLRQQRNVTIVRNTANTKVTMTTKTNVVELKWQLSRSEDVFEHRQRIEE